MKTNHLKTALNTISIAFLITSVSQTQAMETETKKELTAGGAIITGALLGGPAGALAGALSGILFAEHIDLNDELDASEKSMNRAQSKIAQLEHEVGQMESNLAYMKSEAARLDQSLLTRLEFQMLFRTGDDQLTEFDNERIAALVEYLNRNPDLKVRLDGHTDPRGTDEYNNLLAKYRTQTIADALAAKGISMSRIESHSHGDSQAKSKSGDYEGYALDRRVSIEVFSNESSTSSKALATLN